jgi:hypothetical protein
VKRAVLRLAGDEEIDSLPFQFPEKRGIGGRAGDNGGGRDDIRAEG